MIVELLWQRNVKRSHLSLLKLYSWFFSYFKDKDIGKFKSARKQRKVYFFNIPGFIWGGILGIWLNVNVHIHKLKVYLGLSNATSLYFLLRGCWYDAGLMGVGSLPSPSDTLPTGFAFDAVRGFGVLLPNCSICFRCDDSGRVKYSLLPLPYLQRLCILIFILYYRNRAWAW